MRPTPTQLSNPRYRGDARSFIVKVQAGIDPTVYTWSLTAQMESVTEGGAVLFTKTGSTVAGSLEITFALDSADALLMVSGQNIIYEVTGRSGTKIIAREHFVQKILKSEVVS